MREERSDDRRPAAAPSGSYLRKGRQRKSRPKAALSLIFLTPDASS